MSQSLRGDQVFLGLVAVFLHGERLILSQSLRGDQVFLGSGNGCRNRGCRVGLNPSVVVRSFWGDQFQVTVCSFACVSIPPW